MSYCESCGHELPEGKLSCPFCGAAVPEARDESRADYSARDESYRDYRARTAYDRPWDGDGYTSPEPAYSYVPREKTSDRVLGTGAFFATVLLLSLPGLGLLLQIIWALGGTGSLNRRNLARAYLIFTIIGLFLAVLACWAYLEYLGPVIDAVGGYENFFAAIFG